MDDSKEIIPEYPFDIPWAIAQMYRNMNYDFTKCDISLVYSTNRKYKDETLNLNKLYDEVEVMNDLENQLEVDISHLVFDTVITNSNGKELFLCTDLIHSRYTTTMYFKSSTVEELQGLVFRAHKQKPDSNYLTLDIIKNKYVIYTNTLDRDVLEGDMYALWMTLNLTLRGLSGTTSADFELVKNILVKLVITPKRTVLQTYSSKLFSIEIMKLSKFGLKTGIEVVLNRHEFTQDKAPSICIYDCGVDTDGSRTFSVVYRFNQGEKQGYRTIGNRCGKTEEFSILEHICNFPTAIITNGFALQLVENFFSRVVRVF